MKFVKLSLVAIMAGSLSTLSAASLEESIKGVDLYGAIRYRVDVNREKNSVVEQNSTRKSSSSEHNFQGYATLNIPVDENLTSIITTRYSGDVEDANSEQAKDKNLQISAAYFQYYANNFLLTAGKLAIGSPWTDNDQFDGQSGNGVAMAYTGVDGWVFGLAHFFNTFEGYGSGLGNGLSPMVDILGGHSYGSRDLSLVSVIGSMGPINSRLWLSKLQSVYKHAIFFELEARFGGFNARAQINNLKLVDGALKTVPHSFVGTDKGSGTFWGVEAGYDLENFGFKAGYTKNSKKQGFYALEEDNEFIGIGKIINSYYTNLQGAKTWFVSADAKFGKYSLEAGYIHSKAHLSEADTHSKAKEYFISGSYAYSKNFDIDAYYAFYKRDLGATEHAILGDIEHKLVREKQQIRIEATYKF